MVVAAGAAGMGGAGAGAGATAAAAFDMATGAAGRGGAETAGETATVPPRPAFAPGEAEAAACAERMPCGGVCGENGFGAASRGSSAPQPRQNL